MQGGGNFDEAFSVQDAGSRWRECSPLRTSGCSPQSRPSRSALLSHPAAPAKTRPNGAHRPGTLPTTVAPSPAGCSPPDEGCVPRTIRAKSDEPNGQHTTRRSPRPRSGIEV